MGQQEGTGGFTVFILMKGYHLLKRGVRKAKRKYFAPNTEVNYINARTDPKTRTETRAWDFA
jgi:hypothetical protein